jgi:hypothetical protein
MTPLESTIALCETGLMVCAAFWFCYSIRFWAHLMRVGLDLETIYEFNRVVRHQTRTITRGIKLEATAFDRKWRK